MASTPDKDAQWSWLWVRESGYDDAWHVLQLGVPPHLQPGLRRAIGVVLTQLDGSGDSVQRRLRLELAAGFPTTESLLWAADENPPLLLGVAD